jgi:hypothetical protein
MSEEAAVRWKVGYINLDTKERIMELFRNFLGTGSSYGL